MNHDEHVMAQARSVAILKEEKKVENQGIDPCASRMLSERSTI